MIKKNKWKLLISSIVICLPIMYGLINWNQLQEQIVMHWDVNWNPDGWQKWTFAILGISFFLLLVHWVCMFFALKDPKNQNQNNKVFSIILWICPVTSLVISGLIYATALPKMIKPHMIVFTLFGLLFAILGNYLPKCKQNSTIGIRVKWALKNEENWNATHRFSGKVWTIGGILMMGCSFLPEEISMYVFVVLIIVLSILSVGYSYYYFKKKQGRS